MLACGPMLKPWVLNFFQTVFVVYKSSLSTVWVQNMFLNQIIIIKPSRLCVFHLFSCISNKSSRGVICSELSKTPTTDYCFYSAGNEDFLWDTLLISLIEASSVFVFNLRLAWILRLQLVLLLLLLSRGGKQLVQVKEINLRDLLWSGSEFTSRGLVLRVWVKRPEINRQTAGGGGPLAGPLAR